MIKAEMIEELQENELLSYASTCETATYRIDGKINKVYSSMRVLGTSRHRLEIDAEAWITKCSDGTIIAKAAADDTDNDIAHATSAVAKDLIDDLRQTIRTIPRSQ